MKTKSTLSKAKRVTMESSDTPGVGKYNVKTESDKGPKYSAYQHDKETMFGKLVRDKKKKPMPGPGAYKSQNDTVKPRTILGKFSKLTKEINYDNKKPGVGKYNTESSRDFGKGEKNKFTMSKTKRSNLVDESKVSSSARNKNDIKALEPGKYDIKPMFGTGRKALLRGKPVYHNRSKTPGPGYYKQEYSKIKTLKTSPSYGIGLGKKTEVIRKSNAGFPGPGKYDQHNGFDVSDVGKIKAYKFSKDKRMKDKRFMTPGPGAYKLPCSFGFTAPYSGIDNHFV